MTYQEMVKEVEADLYRIGFPAERRLEKLWIYMLVELRCIREDLREAMADR